jgi:hypothetical protein
VAITRTTIHRKFYGALIVFAGSARPEEFRKEALLGIRFEFAPFVAHLTPFESRLEERIYAQALRYFPVAQHGQGQRRGVLGCFRKRPIHLPTAIDARTRSSTFKQVGNPHHEAAYCFLLLRRATTFRQEGDRANVFPASSRRFGGGCVVRTFECVSPNLVLNG